MTQKKVPMRLCAGCHVSKPKKELIRIVKVAQKLLEEGKQDVPICIDSTGKLAGRGAYICKDAKCLKIAMKNKKLEREFEMPISGEVYELLAKQMEN